MKRSSQSGIDDGSLNQADWSASDKIQFGFKFIVSLLSLANLAIDIIYIIEAFFAFRFLFFGMCVLLVIRILLNLVHG